MIYDKPATGHSFLRAAAEPDDVGAAGAAAEIIEADAPLPGRRRPIGTEFEILVLVEPGALMPDPAGHGGDMDPRRHDLDLPASLRAGARAEDEVDPAIPRP